jgi:hypothetical protein
MPYFRFLTLETLSISDSGRERQFTYINFKMTLTSAYLSSSEKLYDDYNCISAYEKYAVLMYLKIR